MTKIKTSVSPWPAGVSKPAARALDSAGVKSLEELCTFKESEIMALHGMGPKAFGVLKSTLAAKGLDFAK